MKRKLMLFVVIAALLSGCTLRLCTPAYVNATTGEQVWSCQSIQRGTKEPVFTLYSPYRTYTKR